MSEESKLTQEQCDALQAFIKSGLRITRLGVAGYYVKECVTDAMATLEGAGYEVILTKPISFVL